LTVAPQPLHSWLVPAGRIGYFILLYAVALVNKKGGRQFPVSSQNDRDMPEKLMSVEYEPVGERIYLVNPATDGCCLVEFSPKDVVENPRTSRIKTEKHSCGDFSVEIPLGEYEDLRVRTALVRHVDYGTKKKVQVSNSGDIYKLMRSIGWIPAESIFVILLNARNVVIGIHEVAKGGTASATAEPANLLQAAVIANAVAIILVHNHPSGEAEASPSDIAFTHAVKKAADIFGIKLLDHVVIGVDAYVSLADLGILVD